MENFKTLKTNINNGVYEIILNRPKQYNSFSIQMYLEVGKALKTAKTNKKIKLVTLTGEGEYFSSGNDLGFFNTAMATGNLPQALQMGKQLCYNFVDSFIKFSKPIMVYVNGPAIGIGIKNK
jgi:Delta3-Delta2-enoyl-CoA isomerase